MLNYYNPSRPMRAAALCLTLSLAAQAPDVNAQTVYGLTAANELTSFSAANPAVTAAPIAISGIAAGQEIAGIDVRPATGELFAIGYNNRTGQTRLYKIDKATAVATAVGTGPVVLRSGMGKIGFDFNPTVDRIRVTGSSDANFRLNPNNGLTVAADGNLKFNAGDVNSSKKPCIGSVAYTNSYIGASSTTLYDYDDSLNILAVQNPPNNGGLNTVGSPSLRVSLTQASDLDIWFDPSTSTNKAYLVAKNGIATSSSIYTINLVNGANSSSQQIGAGSGLSIKDIAIGINVEIPATITGGLAYALTDNNNLITFDTDQPEKVRSQVAISGILGGERIVGLDFRPANGELWTLGYNDVTGQGRFYTINRMTGVATAVSAAYSMPLGNGGVSLDFNPTVDRIRVVGTNRVNLRFNPNGGGLAFTDGQLAYASSSRIPAIGAAAYTNSFRGATTTTLYDYNIYYNLISTQAPPNNGILNPVGNSGLVLNPADLTIDMDIFYNPSNSTNYAYLVANLQGKTTDNLYSINLATGAATLVGKIGNGIAVRDLAIATDSITRSLGLGSGPPPVSSARMSLYPNPTVDQSAVAFDLEKDATVAVEVFDYQGAKVSTLFNGAAAKGHQEVNWSATGQNKGIYFVRLTVDGQVHSVQRLQVR